MIQTSECTIAGCLAFALCVGAPSPTAPGAQPIAGKRPLRAHPENPRYFTDGTKESDGSLKAIFLTGSHTWANLMDRGPSDPPPTKLQPE